jgi:hypothetical protein
VIGAFAWGAIRAVVAAASPTAFVAALARLRSANTFVYDVLHVCPDQPCEERVGVGISDLAAVRTLFVWLPLPPRRARLLAAEYEARGFKDVSAALPALMPNVLYYDRGQRWVYNQTQREVTGPHRNATDAGFRQPSDPAAMIEWLARGHSITPRTDTADGITVDVVSKQRPRFRWLEVVGHRALPDVRLTATLTPLERLVRVAETADRTASSRALVIREEGVSFRHQSPPSRTFADHLVAQAKREDWEAVALSLTQREPVAGDG